MGAQTLGPDEPLFCPIDRLASVNDPTDHLVAWPYYSMGNRADLPVDSVARADHQEFSDSVALVDSAVTSMPLHTYDLRINHPRLAGYIAKHPAWWAAYSLVYHSG